MKPTLVDADSWDLVKRYDALMFDPEVVEYFGGSDFTNFGYWTPDTPDQRRASEQLVEKLVELIPRREGALLDVACGKGATTAHLRRYFDPGNITGVNISSRQLARAKEIAPECRFELMDATDLRFADASLDNIISVEAAFHFDTRERFFEEAYRCLKPGGSLVLSDILMTYEAERDKPYRNEANFVEGPERYRELCRRVGFEGADVIDATKECWEGCYWHAVWFIHERYLARTVSLKKLKEFLTLTYRRARDIRFYLLAACRKGTGS